MRYLGVLSPDVVRDLSPPAPPNELREMFMWKRDEVLRTYARGTGKESWLDACMRVVEETNRLSRRDVEEVVRVMREHEFKKAESLTMSMEEIGRRMRDPLPKFVYPEARL